jgi:hypothetical protein
MNGAVTATEAMAQVEEEFRHLAILQQPYIASPPAPLLVDLETGKRPKPLICRKRDQILSADPIDCSGLVEVAPRASQCPVNDRLDSALTYCRSRPPDKLIKILHLPTRTNPITARYQAIVGAIDRQIHASYSTYVNKAVVDTNGRDLTVRSSPTITATVVGSASNNERITMVDPQVLSQVDRLQLQDSKDWVAILEPQTKEVGFVQSSWLEELPTDNILEFSVDVGRQRLTPAEISMVDRSRNHIVSLGKNARVRILSEAAAGSPTDQAEARALARAISIREILLAKSGSVGLTEDQVAIEYRANPTFKLDVVVLSMLPPLVQSEIQVSYETNGEFLAVTFQWISGERMTSCPNGKAGSLIHFRAIDSAESGLPGLVIDMGADGTLGEGLPTTFDTLNNTFCLQSQPVVVRGKRTRPGPIVIQFDQEPGEAPIRSGSVVSATATLEIPALSE